MNHSSTNGLGLAGCTLLLLGAGLAHAVTVATPTLKPTPGTYGPAQTVTLADATAGATIYYTTNGSTPTTASTKFTAAFKIVATTTVKAIATKSGDSNSAVASGTYTILSPSGLSYPATPPLLIGKAFSLTPTVKGGGLTYTVAPALPAGVAIAATTGVISGTPTKLTSTATYTITAKNSSGSTTATVTTRVDTGPTVQLSSTVSNPSGAPLTYQWKTTDGALIGAANAAIATWELPPGPGIHFAYLLVSNGQGGYDQERVAVNTDSIGNPVVVPAPSTYVAPAAAAPTTVPVRALMQFGSTVGSSAGTLARSVLSPGPGVGGVILDTSSNPVPALGFATPDYRGEAIFDPPLNFDVSDNGVCSFDPGISSFPCYLPFTFQSPFPVTTSFTGYYGSASQLTTGPTFYTGTLRLPGTGSGLLPAGRPCGFVNDFFGVISLASVELLNAGGAVVAGPYPGDVYGGYEVPGNAAATSIRLSCEGAPAKVLPLTAGVFDVGGTVLAAAVPPTITALTAKFNGAVNGSFSPPTAVQPSDSVPYTDRFLGEKGLDTRIGACQYYRAIGAVKSCDAAGKPGGAISFQDWQRTVQIDSFAPAGAPPTYTATYINKVDLNLSRVHHSISYGPNKTAAYVCNHAGPSVLDPAQTEIDSVIANTVANKNLVACVAMDNFVTAGVNGGRPFTRFLIFGPSGQLLPSINLDGRVEKFVPGTCVACHGGDFYTGSYPDDGTGRADVGGRFLPYDTGNFEFSSSATLTEAAQELSIYHLNQNVLKTSPNAATAGLIAGWYAGGSTTLNKNYLPASWAAQGPAATSFYLNVVARGCRSCHVSLGETYNFEDYPMGGTGTVYPGAGQDLDIDQTACGPGLAARSNNHLYEMLRSHSMPNSLITFNRFWNTQGSSTEPDQPAITLAFVNLISAVGPYVDCSLQLPPQ